MDFTNIEQEAEWRDAQEKAAAQTAELTWTEKSLADAIASEGVFKDEGFYRMWKMKHMGLGSSKRGRDDEDEVGHVHKKGKAE